MAITLTLYEETGPNVAGRGTITTAVNNIGWKNAGNNETNPYENYPLTRPLDPDVPFVYSFTKYNYIKISGTYPKASRLRLKINGSVIGSPPDGFYSCQGKVRLFYKLTNTYEEPSNIYDGSLIYVKPDENIIIHPRTSLTGPDTATNHRQYYDTDTTHYSEYLVTQLFVEGDPTPQDLVDYYGNIGDNTFEWYIDEYEDGNV